MWNEGLLKQVQIHDTSNGHNHEEEGAVHSFFAEGAKHVNLWAVTNMFQGDTWMFAAPNPAAVGIGITTDTKRALNIEIYGVQKSIIVLYPMKHLHTEFFTNHLICIRKMQTMGSLYAFECKHFLNTRHTVTVVNLFV
jgi:hypothetical protein